MWRARDPAGMAPGTGTTVRTQEGQRDPDRDPERAREREKDRPRERGQGPEGGEERAGKAVTRSHSRRGHDEPSRVCAPSILDKVAQSLHSSDTQGHRGPGVELGSECTLLTA